LGRWGYFFAGFISALALLVAIALFNLLGTNGHIIIRPQPAYNELLDKINDGSVASASIRGNVVIAHTKAGQTLESWVFSPEKMAENMVAKGIRVHTAEQEVSPSTLLGIFINWLPLILHVLAFWFGVGVPLYGIRATLRRLEQTSRAIPPR
jgi:ATP-dependent Zn protease